MFNISVLNVELVAVECRSFVIFELKAHSTFILVFIYVATLALGS
jgi:hypothetical protein